MNDDDDVIRLVSVRATRGCWQCGWEWLPGEKDDPNGPCQKCRAKAVLTEFQEAISEIKRAASVVDDAPSAHAKIHRARRHLEDACSMLGWRKCGA